jgi:phage gp37-like protein
MLVPPAVFVAWVPSEQAVSRANTLSRVMRVEIMAGVLEGAASQNHVLRFQGGLQNRRARRW